MKFFEKIKNSLGLTKSGVFGKISKLLSSKNKIDEDLLEEIEEVLITGDIGVKTSIEIINTLKSEIKKHRYENSQQIYDILKQIITDMISSKYEEDSSPYQRENHPHVIMIIGVNGVGKTTSIGKLTKRFKENNNKVILIAADTFRAAAIDQLSIWADRNNVEIIKHQPESDPSAVAFDGVTASKARNIDIAIIDTAGRLHNKKHLMDQLDKMNRVIKKVIPEAPHETYLVLDSTMGQNAISQAKSFMEITPIDGIILTKLDGTAKGGVVIGIIRELDIPVKFIGVGEGIDDLDVFDPKAFIEGIFA